jgi:predicted transcriptional regulator of viral defense system
LPLESEPGRPTVAEDPWILANEAFSPCYIGGWSAAEHWGLTEQIFRSTLVVTGAKVRAKSARLLGQEFRLFQVPRHRITGVTAVWRGPERVPVSSAERTIVDCLRYPELSGGIRHLAQIMREYERSEKHDFGKLLAEAKRSANGAAWKRLGFLAESLWPDESALQAAARAHRSTGIVKLDAAAGDRGQILSRWRLRVNVDRKALTRET